MSVAQLRNFHLERSTDQQLDFRSVSMVSQGGIAAQVDYIKAAKAAGVKLFVPAEVTGPLYPNRVAPH